MEIFNLAKYNKVWLSISLATTIISIICIAVFGLNLGIDFKGGSVLDYSLGGEINTQEIKEKLINEGFKVDRIVLSEGNRITIYTDTLSEEDVANVDLLLTSSFEDAERIGVQTVGPSIGKEVTKKAIISILIASLVIVVYLVIVFRSVPKPASSLEFGVTVVIAMFHDVILVLGAFAVLGQFFNAEINSLFITAILTIIGFSIHDSIVVYDRIRENLKKERSEEFNTVVSKSLVEVLARSVNLSVSVLLTLFAIFFLGSESIRWFIAALIIGMLSGTYSSIFVGTQLLVFWEGVKSKFSNRRKIQLKIG